MTNLLTQSIASKSIEEDVSIKRGLFHRIINWFWSFTEKMKDTNTKPFDGIL